jgi:hypothetical protein
MPSVFGVVRVALVGVVVPIRLETGGVCLQLLSDENKRKTMRSDFL